ncbi:hypothetical protein SAMN05444722_3364 [Rhodovulum sp. ES.010]|uniref:hypothetical protein n=1 Tax=Rhodovulum sp. ES.010 TaxID=1882821 RepID=UPI00092C74CD|nr:hypothetical protein [Rhodovulum sp. ES.010]SIO54446.1 hypothetical protein SAMN05444722_3364 [Rhodovulum sp. ES.010]
MKTLALAAALAVLSLPAQAGPIERACLSSDRPGTSRGLCGCIQNAADLTLTRGDQRQAARFFRDPHQAQVIRQSDRRRDADFWQRYKRFGDTAAAYCG